MNPNQNNGTEDISASDLHPHPKAGMTTHKPSHSEPPAPALFQRGTAGVEGLPESTEMSLNEWISNLWGGRYLVLAMVVLAMVYSSYYLWVYVPIYRVDAMLQIEGNKRSMTDKALADIDSMFSGGTEAATEIEILRSNLVMGRTVETLGLDIQAQPVHMRMIGEALARRRPNPPMAEITSFVLLMNCGAGRSG